MGATFTSANLCHRYKTIPHKKGRCKRSGQSKTIDQGAINQRQ
jgi:hypothetical protein